MLLVVLQNEEGRPGVVGVEAPLGSLRGCRWVIKSACELRDVNGMETIAIMERTHKDTEHAGAM